MLPAHNPSGERERREREREIGEGGSSLGTRNFKFSDCDKRGLVDLDFGNF